MKYFKKCLIGLFLLVVLCSLSACSSKKESNKEELEKMLKEMAIAYYEDFYYPQTGKTEKERQAFMKKFKDTGITSTLDNMKLSGLDIIKENSEKFVNSLTDEECDGAKTKIKIVVKEPFSLKDYDVEVTLVCGFEEK